MKRFPLGRIGVLAGGTSNEREISLKSGQAVYDALIREGLDVVFIDVGDDIGKIIKDAKMDTAFIALHGRFGEDGTIQKALEDAGISYTGSGPDASRRAIDKIVSKDIFRGCGIPTPRWVVFEKDNFDMKDAAKLGMPLVVKPQFEGSSIGLSVVRKGEELKEAIDRAFDYGINVLVEEYIDGRELTVGILEEKALPVIEIVSRGRIYDYKAKYNDPVTQYLIPAPIDDMRSARARDLGLEAHKSLGCTFFSRVDMMMDKSGEIFVLEVNTIPGMTERSLLPKAAAAIGLNFNGLCIKLIEDAFTRKRLL